MISFVIPVYNPGSNIKVIIDCIKEYSLFINEKIELMVIDSSSSDGSTKFMEKDNSIKLIKIDKKEFNHGGTRNLGLSKTNGEFIIFLTQDIIPVGYQCFKLLMDKMVDNPKIGIAYGRQLPRKDTNFYGRFARQFNYPKSSVIKSMDDKDSLGIKTVFVSNSFAAYRRSALNSVGGFPTYTIMNEDQYVGAKIINNGWLIAYVAEACVIHSHNYTHIQEFKRYFDIGVFFGKEKWILKEFSSAEGEGIKFVETELKILVQERKFFSIPGLFIRNLMKYIGYKAGMCERFIPRFIKKKLSMNKQYW